MTDMYGSTFENISGLGSKLMAEMLRTGQRPGGRRVPAINPSVEVAPNAPLPMAPNSYVVDGGYNAAPTQQAPTVQEPSFLDSLRGGAGAPVDPYAGQRAEIHSRMLRELDKPDAPRERIDFPQTISPEMMQEHVRQLRGQQTLGNLFQMSGDRALGAAGEQLSRADPMGYMQDYGKHDTTRRYQEWQANYEPKETKYDRISALGQMGRALPNALGAGDNSYQNLPAALSKEIPARAELLSNTQYLQDTFKDEYQQVLGKYQSVLDTVPQWFTSTGLEQVLARVAPEDRQTIADSAQWWSNMAMLYSMPKRHENFGSALTPTENKAWDAARLITPSTNPAEVRKKLAELEREATNGAELRLKTWVPRYGYEGVASPFEGILDRKRGAAPTMSGSVDGVEFDVEED